MSYEKLNDTTLRETTTVNSDHDLIAVKNHIASMKAEIARLQIILDEAVKVGCKVAEKA